MYVKLLLLFGIFNNEIFNNFLIYPDLYRINLIVG